jgi:TPP-dependent trihydroxycyclohexane-1,2-dione (THcHDO) dehydratase
VNVTLVPAQTEDPGLAAILTDAGVLGVTVIVILLLVADVAVTQVSDVVILQVTTSPVASVVVL